MRNLINIVENADPFVRQAPVAALAKVWNPFEQSPWPEVHVITPDDVKDALAGQRLSGDRYDDVMHRFRTNHATKDHAKSYHAGRIAYLVQHPSDDPIMVIENVRGGWDIDDGYHRLAAAIYRGDATIKVRAGAMDEFVHWLSYHEGD